MPCNSCLWNTLKVIKLSSAYCFDGSEVAFFALAGIFMTALAFGLTYVIVGIAMLAAGLYIASRGKYLHWHFLEVSLHVLPVVYSSIDIRSIKKVDAQIICFPDHRVSATA